jgi:hypothetical protein
MAPSGSTKSGNTKRISASKRWTFTLNNYDELQESMLKEELGSNGSYFYGHEVGENGTPHLQGFVILAKKGRPLEMFSNKRIHWEKMKASIENNLKYCSKGKNLVTNDDRWRPVKVIEPNRKWQTKLIKILNREPDDRKIIWIYDKKGNVGKTQFAKYMCVKNERCLYTSGKAADMKYAIYQMKVKPNIVIIDVPRSHIEYLSYNGIEQIKNGIFFNTKYESGMCVFNSPHMVIFANEKPEIEKLSLDRWELYEIRRGDLFPIKIGGRDPSPEPIYEIIEC